MYVFLTLALGVAIGVVITRMIDSKRHIGVLRVNNSDPDDGPYLFLELFKEVPNLAKMKFVILKVDLRQYDPRKKQ
jgi:hypothetical protein